MSYLASLIASPWALRRELMPLASRVLARIASGARISVEDRQTVEAGKSVAAARRTESAKYANSGGGTVAVIPVTGVLSQRGGIDDTSMPLTSMSQLATTIRSAAMDPAISAIVLDIDSPGGTVQGAQELADVIFNARTQKVVAAVANSCAASAAYWLASQASELYAAPGAEVGSIGVYTCHCDVSEALKQDGIAPTLIAAGKFKTELSSYGPLTAEARAAVQGTVDAHYDAFVRAVARGRGTSQKAVREGMGQGRMLLPDQAKAEDMIDGVATLGQVVARMLDRTQRGSGTAKASTGSARARLQRDIDILSLE
jgi:signal peptide peptidase SppA